VNEAIAAYLEAVDRCESPDGDKFLAEHAYVANKLKSFFADQSKFRRSILDSEFGTRCPHDPSKLTVRCSAAILL
jgi:hypothetical protein